MLLTSIGQVILFSGRERGERNSKRKNRNKGTIARRYMRGRTVALHVVWRANKLRVSSRKKYNNFISDIVFIAIGWDKLRLITPGTEIQSLL
jgi:hypothetical protein